jgi:radical SAM superfamily enzyme YgiQ (UPF0313 family)
LGLLPKGVIIMKVLLIYPDSDQLSVIPRKLINIEPLGLEYLAGTIPQHEVKILDMKIEKNWQREMEEFQPEVVGISGTVIHTYRMLEVLRRAKQMDRRILTVVGGAHATLMPNDFNKPYVDAIVLGHRPLSFRQIVENFERRKPLDEIEGLAFSNEGKLRFTPVKSPVTDLDHLPLPRRDLTEKHRKKYFHLMWKPTALIVTSAGCAPRCNFCPCPVLTQGRYLRRSPELVLQELLQIKEEYIYAGDDDFFFDYRHALQIYQLVKAAGIKKQYYILSRTDSINRHPDIVEKWAEIGLKKVFLGLESFRDEELESFDKKCSIEKNNQAIEILHQNKVDPLGAFVIQPYYKKADFDALLEYMDKMKIYYHELTILTPFPGTELHDKVKNQITHNDNRLFDLAHSLLPTEIPSDEFYRLFSRLYRKAYSPIRAMRIKPTVSPFAKLAFLRLLPGIFSLFHSGKKAYRNLAASNNH